MIYLICLVLFVIFSVCIHKLNELVPLFWKCIIPFTLIMLFISMQFWNIPPSPPSYDIQQQEFENAYNEGYEEAVLYYSENFSTELARYRAEEDAKKDFEDKYSTSVLYEIGYSDGVYDRTNPYY